MADMAPYLLRLALYLVLMLLFGQALQRRATARPRTTGVLLLATLLLVVVEAITRLCSVLGTGWAGVDADSALWYFGSMPVGRAALLCTAALLGCLGLLGLRRLHGTTRQTEFAVLAATALGSLAWNGHATAGEGLLGQLRLLGGIVHLLAAGAWVAAIAGLLARTLHWRGAGLRERALALQQALHDFAWPGTVIVVVLAVTGSYSYVDMDGTLATLAGTAHGHWLLLKLALVAGMLGLAALHRWRLVPALRAALADPAQTAKAASRLRASLACEARLVVLVLACVAVLGTLDPLS
ncbi:MAG: Copper resistance protein D [Stenotrophomonas maltophilia]|uniref:Copper resistance protein D n=1 Tax=Stenotrophomonas maltophilia TaxID=40324 RepID=A0A7V8FIV4_STEMA|nr:MAG: Copper resistance protein D [Stenotrophomonas maltophilia]